MKRKRLLALFAGGVFIAAVMSLHRMLEQGAEPQQEAPAGQGDQDLSRLAQKIDRLERLLSDNNPQLTRCLAVDWPTRQRAEPTKCSCWMFTIGSRSITLPGGVWKQGFDIRYQGDEWDETPLEVILVPHSHNDPGWLKTFDNYYHDQTKHILNNMLTKLSEDSRRKMIWAEISYFSRWWEELDQKKRDTVKRLLAGGQLEMVTGGWVMADEANSHYYALLDQLIEGHQWIQTHLGVKPSSGWAIDPFGHSPSMAYLLKGAGLSNMVIQRVHYAVKKEFARQQTLEFRWRQSWDSSPLSDITCHMMPFYSYDVPHTCGPDPAVCCQFDFHRLPGGRVFCPWRVPPQPITEQNVQERALLLLDQYRRKSRLFRSPVLFVPLGDDFRFVEPSEWDAQFRNYQQLFAFFQTHPELHVSARFGTLSDYFQALQKVLPVSSLPTVRGDFFTYADRDDHYWSGYFTSRPFYKRLDRTLEATLRATEILYSLTLAAMRSHGDGHLATGFPAQDHFLLLTAGRRGLALFQHHDAVTGTARDPVVMDYGNRLLESIQKLRKVLQSSAHWLLLLDKSQYHHNQSKPFLLTDDVMSAQDALPQKTKITLSEEPRILIVYNPTEQIRSSVVSVVIDSPDAQVIDAETGQPMAAQISAVWAEPSRASTDSFQLDFLSELPPLSLVVYHVTRSSSGSAPRARYTFHRRGNPPTIHSEHFQIFRPQGPEANAPLSLSNKHVQIWSSPETGLMQKLRLRAGSERQVQGAQVYSFSEPPLVRVSRGPLYSDITSCLRHVTHTVRLYHLEGHAGRSLEISNMVDIRSQVNRELVMRIVTDVASGNRFHSDLNSFQMQQRRTLSKLPLQANFYPMSSAAFLQDAETRITVLSAQSQGVASLRPGELELVLDRRLQQDDNRGLGQGVMDNKRTSSLYHLLLEERRGGQEVGGASVEHLSLLAHLTSLSLSHPPITMVAPVDVQVPKLRPFLPLRSSLPCDLHLLNLRTLEDPQEAGAPSQEVALLLHRKGFDCSSAPEPALQCTWSAHEEVDLAAAFAPLRFSALRRSGLTMLRHDDEPQSARQQQTRIISLRPMDISAFRVEVQ
ncbi:hypothetical protein CesoFtcFv8_023687 [Champsocephalus esox]|uniref:Alpha-mannosidase n=1 Tax=Champsocephalus esox TaxID=159716 RepID=A0AAN8B4S0_9TELE|nr:hypothetical protein CesoFtcFv8_023687 [Champsocephalus esox]